MIVINVANTTGKGKASQSTISRVNSLFLLFQLTNNSTNDCKLRQQQQQHCRGKGTLKSQVINVVVHYIAKH